MEIEISYGDFDTVCYSNQHNIMELIKQAVNMGLQININIGDIASAKSEIAAVGSQVSQTQDDLDSIKDFAQEGHDAWLMVEYLHKKVSGLEYEFKQVWDDTVAFRSSSELGKTITALEGGE